MKFLIVNPDTNGQSILVINTDTATGIATPAVSVAPGQDVTVEVLSGNNVTVLTGEVHIVSDDPEPLVPDTPVVSGTPIPAALPSTTGADATVVETGNAQDDTAVVSVIPPTTDAVVSTDPAHGAADGSPVIITQAQDGTVVATPVVTGDVQPGTVAVAPDGTPSAVGITVGEPAQIADVPPPADLAASGAADPVGAPQSTDGQIVPTTDLGDASGQTPITDNHAAAAATAPVATDATVVSVIQSLEGTDSAFTAQGMISIDHLNAALVAAGFAPVTVDHPAVAAQA